MTGRHRPQSERSKHYRADHEPSLCRRATHELNLRAIAAELTSFISLSWMREACNLRVVVDPQDLDLWAAVLEERRPEQVIPQVNGTEYVVIYGNLAPTSHVTGLPFASSLVAIECVRPTPQPTEETPHA